MNQLNRRQFIHRTTLASLAGGAFLPSFSKAAEVKRRKMTRDLVCGNIGVSANQREAIELAARHGFESVGADGAFLASLSDEQVTELKSFMKTKGIVFGAAGLPVEFRRDEARFGEDLKGLPKFAAGLQRAGVDRVSTWLMPCHDTLPYLENFRQHVTRLREVAKTLKEHGVRLGLEYVGPKTSWASRRYSFIHTLAEMKELIGEINTGTLGFVLDSWHWWHAGDTAADLLALKESEVIAVDLNDAPAGVPKDQQPDGRRELPCATGVIDIGAFLNALNEISYDGPVRAEPFNQAVNKMARDEGCQAASAALKKAFTSIT
ncbi:MAG TPA: sugar phosphate isomerase/epimerase family protein [Candidatus Binatia bacterium]|jgi:sugar phosphate isomerase/epimerase|nr:sugar phosphate isomerase/epimerase family protein [Candidatus Binatia bacterium]